MKTTKLQLALTLLILLVVGCATTKKNHAIDRTEYKIMVKTDVASTNLTKILSSVSKDHVYGVTYKKKGCMVKKAGTTEKVFTDADGNTKSFKAIHAGQYRDCFDIVYRVKVSTRRK